MFCRVLAVSLGLLLGGAALDSHAGLISLWSFDSDTGSATTINANTDIGTQTGSAATLTSSGHNSFPTGTTLGDPRTSPSATLALQFDQGTGSVILHLSGTGLSAFQVAYVAKTTGQNPIGDQNWTWSTTGAGGSYSSTGITQPSTLTTTFATRTADFSGVTALNGAADVYLRLTFSDKDVFDNIQVTAVPEPVNVALACFGLSFAGVAFGRLVLRRLQKRVKTG